MDYNFANVSADLITDIDKKLRKITESFLDDINNFILLLNDEHIQKNVGELNTVLIDLFSDEIKKTVISFTGTMNKVQNALRQYT